MSRTTYTTLNKLGQDILGGREEGEEKQGFWPRRGYERKSSVRAWCVCVCVCGCVCGWVAECMRTRHVGRLALSVRNLEELRMCNVRSGCIMETGYRKWGRERDSGGAGERAEGVASHMKNSPYSVQYNSRSRSTDYFSYY